MLSLISSTNLVTSTLKGTKPTPMTINCFVWKPNEIEPDKNCRIIIMSRILSSVSTIATGAVVVGIVKDFFIYDGNFLFRY